MAGPRLTTTDVSQRLRAFDEESYASYPNEERQAGYLAVYTADKAECTDMPAIVGLLQKHVERAEERLRLEHDQRWRKRAEDDRIALARRFLSGADCKGAALMIDTLPKADAMLGDRGYDADWFRHALIERGITPVYPIKSQPQGGDPARPHPPPSAPQNRIYARQAQALATHPHPL